MYIERIPNRNSPPAILLRQALAPLLFDDEELNVDRKVRDPVAPAQLSESARRKKSKGIGLCGLTVHSFETLLRALATRCRNKCRMESYPAGVTIEQLTQPTSLQIKAAELLEVYPVEAHQVLV